MQIEPHGRLTFLVESATLPGVVYTVDLGAKIPECSCPHFQFRCRPRIKEAFAQFPGNTEAEVRRRHLSMKANTCQHMRAVTELMFWDYLDKVRELYADMEDYE